MAFIMRYGHQQRTGLLRLTVRELNEVAEDIGEIVNDERQSFESGLSDPD